MPARAGRPSGADGGHRRAGRRVDSVDGIGAVRDVAVSRELVGDRRPHLRSAPRRRSACSCVGASTMPLTAPVRSTSAPPAAHAVPSASRLEQPAGHRPRVAATTASVEDRMPLLIHGLVSRGGAAPKIHTLSPGLAAHLGERNGTHRSLRVEQHETGRRRRDRGPLASTSSPSLVVTLDRGRVADDGGAGQDLAAVAHADPAALPGADRVLRRDEHETRARPWPPAPTPPRRRVRTRSSAGTGRGRCRRPPSKAPSEPEHADGDERAERAGRERHHEMRLDPGAGARRRPDRAQLGRVDPDAVHAVRRRAARLVVLGPHGVVVAALVDGPRGPRRPRAPSLRV